MRPLMRPFMRRPPILLWLYRSEPSRVVQLALGLLLLAISPVIAILSPIPLSFFVVLGLGLTLTLRNSRWARRRYLRYTARYPRVRQTVDYSLRRRRKPGPGPGTAPAAAD